MPTLDIVITETQKTLSETIDAKIGQNTIGLWQNGFHKNGGSAKRSTISLISKNSVDSCCQSFWIIEAKAQSCPIDERGQTQCHLMIQSPTRRNDLPHGWPPTKIDCTRPPRSS